MANIEIICGDSLEVMKTFPDNHFDLCLTDPPYGKKYARGKNGFGSAETSQFSIKDVQWDAKTPSKEYFSEIFRVSKNQVIWGMNYFIEHLTSTNCVFVWDKLTGENPYADCELAWASYNSVVKKFTKLWLGSHAHRSDEILHPTQKPRELMIWCLKQAGDVKTVLDPFAGSGTTGVACEALGIDCTLVEINEKYVQDIHKRVQEEKDKMGLFPE